MEISRRGTSESPESGSRVLFPMTTVLKSKLLRNDSRRSLSGQEAALSVPVADGRFCAASLSRGFLVKGDTPLWSLVVPGGALPSEQGLMSGILSGCSVQYQSIKRHLGTGVAYIRGRPSAPTTLIPANSEGQGSHQGKPTGFCCVLSERTRVTDFVWPPLTSLGASTGLVWEDGPIRDSVPWRRWVLCALRGLQVVQLLSHPLPASLA